MATGTVAVLLALSDWLVLELGDAVPRFLYPAWMLRFGGLRNARTYREWQPSIFITSP